MQPERERGCPVCGNRAARLFLKKGDLTLRQCDQCKMIYVSPIPAELESGNFYREAASYYLSEAKLASDYNPVRFNRELKLFRKYCLRGDVLDVGCSNGAFLAQLATRFPNQYSIYGTDISSSSLDYAQSRGVKTISGNFLKQDFGALRFDAISFWAVLEHLTEPKPFLEKAAQLLKEGGTCFVLVPNMNSLAVRVLGSKYRYILPEHLNYFTKRTLLKLAGDLFEVTAVRYTHFNPLVIVKDLIAPESVVPQKDRMDLLQKTTQLKTNPVLAPLKLVYSGLESVLSATHLTDNVVVVLRKKIK